MAFKVLTQRQAELDLVSAFEYVAAAGAPEAAARWYRNAKAHIESLAEMPERCPVALEAEKLGFELRQLNFGKRTGVYRIIFRVLHDPEEVHILGVRHGARDELRLEDLV